MQLSPGACPAVTGERGERGQESSLLSLDRWLWAALTPSSVAEPAMSHVTELLSADSCDTPPDCPHTTFLTSHENSLPTSPPPHPITSYPTPKLPDKDLQLMHLNNVGRGGPGGINITDSQAGQIRECPSFPPLCPSLQVSRFQDYPRY